MFHCRSLEILLCDFSSQQRPRRSTKIQEFKAHNGRPWCPVVAGKSRTKNGGLHGEIIEMNRNVAGGCWWYVVIGSGSDSW